MTIVHRCTSEIAGHDAPDRFRPRNPRNACCAALYAGFLAAATALPAQADMAGRQGDIDSFPLDSFSRDQVRLSDEELRSLRGGMSINGVDFDFGATVRIFVDGPLVAETSLTLNPDGSIARNTTIHDATSTAPFTSPSQLEGSKIHFASAPNADGFVISGPNGLSLALNSLKAGEIMGLLANDAAGRNIMQTIEVNVTINNFTQINSNLQSSIAMGRAISAGIPNAMLAH
ncbi:MAG TPA: hypothetical protein VG742_19110 [Dongiaceae bacterium]|nr:hypothetical protein [Dongiaceae bacterium]